MTAPQGDRMSPSLNQTRYNLMRGDPMGEAAVREILRRIDELPEADRVLLERELSERLEAEWQRESAAARDEAARRGIDQEVIDRAVERVRYGKPAADEQ